MRWFLRKSAVGREPLPITMSGVRPGERVLQIGVDDPRLAAAVAAKVGLSGEATIVVATEHAAARVRRATAGLGVLMDVHVTPFDLLPFPDAAFDLAIVHGGNGFIAGLEPGVRGAALRESHRVLRPGGRLLSMEPGNRGLSALFRGAPPRQLEYDAAGGTLAALNTAGFAPVRMLADRDGFRFIEGVRSRPSV